MGENFFIFTRKVFFVCNKICLYLPENFFVFVRKFFYICEKAQCPKAQLYKNGCEIRLLFFLFLWQFFMVKNCYK